jgi:hypothetical protein
MGFFILWWLGEVSNLPQGPREALPTPSMFSFCLLVLFYRSSKDITASCQMLLKPCSHNPPPLALALGDPLLCRLTRVAAARIEFSQ